ncbi:MAG: hypothetical protein WA624_02455 [Methylocella sp.]
MATIPEALAAWIKNDGLGFVEDSMKDLFKAALVGAALSAVNLFATEQHEQQQLNRIKTYEELLKLKDAMAAV